MGVLLFRQKSGLVVMLCSAGFLFAPLRTLKGMVLFLILMLLFVKEWGPLAITMGKTTITNERAIILIANVHFFLVSIAATVAPLPFGDTLFIDPYSDKYARALARNNNPYGYLPQFKVGLTDEAEMYNGRLAMLGLICVIFTSALQNKPILDVVNEWVGGAYY